jgi:hypothetical protein
MTAVAVSVAVLLVCIAVGDSSVLRTHQHVHHYSPCVTQLRLYVLSLLCAVRCCVHAMCRRAAAARCGSMFASDLSLLYRTVHPA